MQRSASSIIDTSYIHSLKFEVVQSNRLISLSRHMKDIDSKIILLIHISSILEK